MGWCVWPKCKGTKDVGKGAKVTDMALKALNAKLRGLVEGRGVKQTSTFCFSSVAYSFILLFSKQA